MSRKRVPPPPKLNTKRKKRKKWSFLRFIGKSILVCLILLILGVVSAFLGYKLIAPHYQTWAEEYDLESINEVERPSIIYDRHGKEIGRIYIENRSYIPLNKISKHMINALVAQEDSRFRSHNGFDLLGIGRAVREFFKAGNINQGASTITQQLARNAYNLEKRAEERSENKFGRKVAEIFLALRIEERYNKDQILEFYLNRIYLGEGFYGIRAASLGYFGKEPIDLTSREAASIAALIKSPNKVSPIKNPSENLRWRNHVLSRMMQEGYLTPSEAERLKKMDLGLNEKPLTRGVSHIYSKIEKQVSDYFGQDIANAGGLKIYTTLDKDIQDEAVRALTSQLNEIEKRPGYSHPLARNFQPDGVTVPKYIDGSVLLIENKTGGILAYVGGRDFSKRQYDAVELGSRPPGTAFLPIVYAALFEDKVNPATIVMDDAMDNRLAGIGGMEGILGEWGAETSRSRYEGNISARRALSASKIAASIRLGQSMGTKKLMSTMGKFKLTRPIAESTDEKGEPIYRNRVFVGTEPLTLRELTQAYTAFSSYGSIIPDLYVIEKITAETGDVIWTAPQTQSTPSRNKAIEPGTAFQIYSIMKDSLENGSASQLKQGFDPSAEIAVKTGTNYGFSDNWCMATNSEVTGGVWIGFPEGRKPIYEGAFSVDTAGPVLANIMNASLRIFSPKPITAPDDIDSIEICKVSGKRATRFCYEQDPTANNGKGGLRRCTYLEYFRKGAITIPMCTVHGEDGVSLAEFINSIGPDQSTRILPLPPVIPTAPVLIGDDPYHSEQVEIKLNSGNYQYNFFTQGQTGPEESVVVEEADEVNNDALLTIPPPPKLKLAIPDL